MSFLFYDDSPIFGGHEVMTLAGLEAVLKASPVSVRFLASEANSKLLDALAALQKRHPQLHLDPLPWQSSKLEALRHRLKPARVAHLAEIFRRHAPGLVVAIQGNIEHSSLALLAARSAGIPSTSYIPVPHSNHEMGARFGALRDLFSHRLFRIPDSFVTITDEMARLLRTRGATAPIHLVYNGIDVHRFTPGPSAAARETLGLPLDSLLLGVVGRTEFRQKQQHLLVEAVANDPDLRTTAHLVFAGDGPDADTLRALLRERGVAGTLLPWCDPAPLYRALDALVIPSRYEGLPLVMLEALASGTPVFASDRDGMRDFLPLHHRFRANDSQALHDVLRTWLQAGKPAADPALVDRVRTHMSLDAFARAFAGTLCHLLAGPGKMPEGDASIVNFSVITFPEN
ncbi:glycosyltransferase involved in cell wall biosynthesis [Haloferula luteola]|uniref:Glycosyltransferase involved in cell wall biosynthesis n=1 Tax=Haloferula luteola TaxID=595692 RepID=A0A840V5H2_9BACT|nr:glycosyltransferase [Haloferula luteola]MBB5350874.1 glycosyltransferase involved in cell wall biosynthesis [Haloferula luteola]